MASVLTEIIPAQGFEIVENRIAEILLEELTNQQCLQKLTDEFGIFIERQEPYDKSEDVMISLSFRDGNYEGYNSRDCQGEYMYFIDIFTKGAGSLDQTPSINAKDKLFQYSGMIRYILNSSKYPTLKFPPGLIGGKYVKKITFDTDYSNFGNHSNYDGAFIRFCRIIYIVRVQENQSLWDGIPLQGNDTRITYDNTEKGIQIKFNN